MNDKLYMNMFSIILGSGLNPDVISETLECIVKDWTDYVTVQEQCAEEFFSDEFTS